MKRIPRPRSTAFTVLEAVVAVVILMVLAAAAIPVVMTGTHPAASEPSTPTHSTSPMFTLIMIAAALVTVAISAAWVVWHHRASRRSLDHSEV